MKTFQLLVLLGFGCLQLLLGSISAASELPPLPELDAYKPIMLDPLDLPKVKGFSINDLSVAAIIDDVVEPIPFQVDEYNEGGAVYFENWNVPIQGARGIFDGEDKFLFLFKDAGPRRNANHIFDGKVLAEVELSGADAVKRYVYIVYGSKLRSDEQYVRYSSEHARVETDFYTLTYDKENHLNWREFLFENFVGDPPLDSMKIRLNAGLLTSFTETALNNDEFVAVPDGERIGPIRTTTQLTVTLWLLKLPIMKISAQLHHYPKGLFYDVRVVMPEVRRKLLVNPVLSLSLDANNLIGSTIRTALGPKEPSIVDGVLAPEERQMIESGISNSENWIWVSTKRKMDIMAFFNFLGETNEPISLHLQDDKEMEDPPERFKGQLPNIGYTINNFPQSGFFGFVVSIMMSDGFEGNPEVFSEAARMGPDVRVYSH